MGGCVSVLGGGARLRTLPPAGPAAKWTGGEAVFRHRIAKRKRRSGFWWSQAHEECTKVHSGGRFGKEAAMSRSGIDVPGARRRKISIPCRCRSESGGVQNGNAFEDEVPGGLSKRYRWKAVRRWTPAEGGLPPDACKERFAVLSTSTDCGRYGQRPTTKRLHPAVHGSVRER